MSRFVPKIHIKPGIPPLYKDGNERPSDHKTFGPDDTANAVRTLTEACKLWPDDFVQQIDHVDISWAGYFKPSYQFVLYHNTDYTDCWGGEIVLESRFQTPQEVIEMGNELAKSLLEQIDFYYRHRTNRETLLSRVVKSALPQFIADPCGV